MKEELITILISASPVLEIRGAIPLAMIQFDFPIWKAYLFGFLGNMLPVIPVLFFLKKFSELLMHKWYFFNRLMIWLQERFQKKHRDHFESFQWSFLALFLFVAVPLPFTGAWSGIAAAHILGIPFWRAVLAITLGIIVSGLLVILLTHSGISIFSFLQ